MIILSISRLYPYHTCCPLQSILSVHDQTHKFKDVRSVSWLIDQFAIISSSCKSINDYLIRALVNTYILKYANESTIGSYSMLTFILQYAATR